MKTFFKILGALFAFIVWLLICINTASAEEIEKDNWTETEITGQVISTALLAVDWAQTLDIKNHPRKCTETTSQTHWNIDCYEIRETNPFLGKHPSDKKINLYFGLIIPGEFLAADALPQKYRNLLLDGTISVEALVVGHNKAIGLRIKF